jgi:hypothetical protein
MARFAPYLFKLTPLGSIPALSSFAKNEDFLREFGGVMRKDTLFN